ncbi:hypothetical protein ACFQJ7_12475 [Halovenus rubra]|uniref:Uncharacterized protein n=2 Tax=Halovenus rubra TaxID=869890 RepID=A0ACC7E0J1_9EURY|nr:hypothetical protein [Halovenus rubra]
MERREFLTTASIGITTAVTGCLSQASSTGSSEPDMEDSTPTRDQPTTETNTTPESTRLKSGETAKRTLGSGSLDESGLRKPHHVALSNQSEQTQTVTLTIQRAESTVLDERFELTVDATVDVSLTDLDTYDAEVTVAATETTETVTIDPAQFTCNVVRTTMSVQADGSVDSAAVSTKMACPGVVTATVDADESVSHTLGDEPVPQDTGAEVHNVLVHNPSNQSWTARVLLDQATTPRFDGLYTIAPNGTVLLTLTESDTYDMEVEVLETDSVETAQIASEDFDCNESSTRAEIDDEGALTMSTVSTRMACGTDVENGTSDDSE